MKFRLNELSGTDYDFVFDDMGKNYNLQDYFMKNIRYPKNNICRLLQVHQRVLN